MLPPPFENPAKCADGTYDPESEEPSSLWNPSTDSAGADPVSSSAPENSDVTPTPTRPEFKSGSHRNDKAHDPKAPKMDAVAFKEVLGFNKGNNVIYLELRRQIKERLKNMNIVHRSAAGDLLWNNLITWVLENPHMAHLKLAEDDGGFGDNEDIYREATHFLCMSCTRTAGAADDRMQKAQQIMLSERIAKAASGPTNQQAQLRRQRSERLITKSSKVRKCRRPQIDLLPALKSPPIPGQRAERASARAARREYGKSSVGFLSNPIPSDLPHPSFPVRNTSLMHPQPSLLSQDFPGISSSPSHFSLPSDAPLFPPLPASPPRASPSRTSPSRASLSCAPAVLHTPPLFNQVSSPGLIPNGHQTAPAFEPRFAPLPATGTCSPQMPNAVPRTIWVWVYDAERKAPTDTAHDQSLMAVYGARLSVPNLANLRAVCLKHVPVDREIGEIRGRVKLLGSHQPYPAHLTDDEEVEVWLMTLGDSPEPPAVTVLLQPVTAACVREGEEPPSKRYRQQRKTRQDPRRHTHRTISQMPKV